MASAQEAREVWARLPTDLRLVVGATGLLWLVTLAPVLSETPLRIAVAVPFALFVPGYALISALFPEAKRTVPDDEQADTADTSGTTGIDTLERGVLAFGASIALVPLTGLLLNVTPWGIRLVSILVALSALTLALTGIAARRRTALSAADRYDPAVVATGEAVVAALTDGNTRADAVLNVVLLVSICLAAGSVAYAVTVPPDGESFTEFYLLTENESGELVAGNYPENLTTSESHPLVIGIGNQEGEATNYTVVTELQRVRIDGNQTVVTDRQKLDRVTRRVEHNETAEIRQRVTPEGMTGQRLRLQFRLYRGSLSDDRSTDPYREIHLWVTVTSGSEPA